MKSMKILFVILIAVLAFSGLMTVSAQEETIYVEATVATDLLYVRSGPGTTYAQVGQLTYGMVVGILGRNEVNPAAQTWVYITGGGHKGWVSIAYLQFPENYILVGVPVLMSGAAPVASSGAPASTGGSATVPEGALRAKSLDYVNFRTGPGLEYDVIRQYPKDTNMAVIGRNANNVWFNVVINGQVGWVFYQLIDINGNEDSLPVTHGAPQQAASTTASTSNTTSATLPGGGSDNTYNIVISAHPEGNSASDGRLNPNTYLGVALLYCIDSSGYTNVGSYRGGGIIVLHFDNPRKGVVFMATEQQINSVGIPSHDVGIKLIKSESGYSLYRLSNGLFQMNGTTSDWQNFVFKWRDCSPGPLNIP